MRLAKPKTIVAAIRPCEFWCSLGIALNFVWCSLESHSLSFGPSINAMEAFLNPRIFWLVGVLVISLCFLARPRFFSDSDHVLRFAVPVLSTLGTGCFAIAYSQTLVSPLPLAMLGLALSGFGYMWFVSRFLLVAARTSPYQRCVWLIVAAVLEKTALLVIINALAPFAGQIYLALLLPLINVIVFARAQASASADSADSAGSADAPLREGHPDKITPLDGKGEESVFGIPARPRHMQLDRQGQNNLIALMVIAAFLFAVVRRLSFWGLWNEVGSTFPSEIWQLAELAAIALFLIPFAWLTLIATRGYSLAFRYQPALIVILAILLFMSLGGDESVLSAELQPLAIHIGESFAYVLFWSIIVVALDALDKPSFRIFGIAEFSFAAFSLFWVSCFGDSISLNGMVILLVAYTVLIAVTVFSFRETKRHLDSTQQALRKAVAEEAAAHSAGASAETFSLTSGINQRCATLAETYRLSPRETEIFRLLAQGRTRSVIQEELVLSDSTVKTHITHIYSKLGVANRQEMIDLVLAEDSVSQDGKD